MVSVSNRIDELAGFVGLEYRRLAAFDHVLGPAHDRGRVHGNDLAEDKPVEQHPDGGQVLLNARC